MMTCTQNGALAYLLQYDEWVRGDAYVSPTGGLIFRVCARFMPVPDYPGSDGEQHFVIYTLAAWFDRDLTAATSTLIADRWEHGAPAIGYLTS